jgi:hypothetical protein
MEEEGGETVEAMAWGMIVTDAPGWECWRADA